MSLSQRLVGALLAIALILGATSCVLVGVDRNQPIHRVKMFVFANPSASRCGIAFYDNSLLPDNYAILQLWQYQAKETTQQMTPRYVEPPLAPASNL